MDWVFQCNPKRYDLASELEKGTQTEDWSMNQHRELVSPGDRVFFWQTGSNAGCSPSATSTHPSMSENRPLDVTTSI
jgi:hypothetical protein